MTIGLALIVAELFVVVLFGILGPEGEHGQIFGRSSRMCGGGMSSIAPELFASTQQHAHLDADNYDYFTPDRKQSHRMAASDKQVVQSMSMNPTVPTAAGTNDTAL